MLNLGAHSSNDQPPQQQQRQPQRPPRMTGFVPSNPPDPPSQRTAQGLQRQRLSSPVLPAGTPSSSSNANAVPQNPVDSQASLQQMLQGVPWFLWPPNVLQTISSLQQKGLQSEIQRIFGPGFSAGNKNGGNNPNTPVAAALNVAIPLIPADTVNHQTVADQPAPIEDVHGNFDNFPDDFGRNQISPERTADSVLIPAKRRSEAMARMSASPAVVPNHFDEPNTPQVSTAHANDASIPVEPMGPSGSPEAQPMRNRRSDASGSVESRAEPVPAEVPPRVENSLTVRMMNQRRNRRHQPMGQLGDGEDQAGAQSLLQGNQQPKEAVVVDLTLSDSDDDEVVVLHEIKAKPPLCFNQMRSSPFGSQENQLQGILSELPKKIQSSIQENPELEKENRPPVPDDDLLLSFSQAHPDESHFCISPIPSQNLLTEPVRKLSIWTSANRESSHVQKPHEDGISDADLSTAANKENQNPSTEQAEASSDDAPMNDQNLQKATPPQAADIEDTENPTADELLKEDGDELMSASQADPTDCLMALSPVPVQAPEDEEVTPEEALAAKMKPYSAEKAPVQVKKRHHRTAGSLSKKSQSAKPPAQPNQPKNAPARLLPKFDKLEERGIHQKRWSKYCLSCLVHGLVNKHDKVSVCRLRDCRKEHLCHWKQREFEKALALWKSQKCLKRSWKDCLKENEDLWDSQDEEPAATMVKRELAKEKTKVRRLKKLLKKRNIEKTKRSGRTVKKSNFMLRVATNTVIAKRKYVLAEEEEDLEMKRRRLDSEGSQTPVEDLSSCGSHEMVEEALEMHMEHQENQNVVVLPKDGPDDPVGHQKEVRTDDETATVISLEDDRMETEENVEQLQMDVTDEADKLEVGATREGPSASASLTRIPVQPLSKERAHSEAPVANRIVAMERAHSEPVEDLTSSRGSRAASGIPVVASARPFAKKNRRTFTPPTGSPNLKKLKKGAARFRRSLDEVVADMRKRQSRDGQVLSSMEIHQNQLIDSAPCTSSAYAAADSSQRGTTKSKKTIFTALNDLLQEDNLQGEKSGGDKDHQAIQGNVDVSLLFGIGILLNDTQAKDKAHATSSEAAGSPEVQVESNQNEKEATAVVQVPSETGSSEKDPTIQKLNEKEATVGTTISSSSSEPSRSQKSLGVRRMDQNNDEEPSSSSGRRQIVETIEETTASLEVVRIDASSESSEDVVEKTPARSLEVHHVAVGTEVPPSASISSTPLISPAIQLILQIAKEVSKEESEAEQATRAQELVQENIHLIINHPETPKKPRYCAKCAVHGVHQPLKGHFYSCLYKTCDCKLGCDKLEVAKMERRRKYQEKHDHTLFGGFIDE